MGVAVLMAPKMYKKPYLSLTSKLLSSSFGVGILLSNHALIKKSQYGLKHIESVVNPRSIPVYNEPLALVKNTKNSTNIDGNVGSLRRISEWNDKMRHEIVNENRFDAKNTMDEDKKDDEDEEHEDVNGDMTQPV